MNTYERLQDEACEDGVDVIDYTFHSNRIKGLYSDGVVAIREDMTIPEKTCALAEEIGHHETSYGNIIDMNSVQNRKQERQARFHGYNTAEYLEVTEEFLEECIACYREKYGVYKIVDNYIIYFIPNLAVFKRI